MRRFLICMYIGISLASLAWAQPQISGPQSGNLGPGTLIVAGNISVLAGQTLTIAPGTTLLHNGYWYWRIYGTLHAVGTVADSIKWLRQNHIAENRWAGIQFHPGATPGSIFSYCVFEYGYKAESAWPNKGGAIYTTTIPLTIAHCRMSFNDADGGGGGILGGGGERAHQ